MSLHRDSDVTAADGRHHVLKLLQLRGVMSSSAEGLKRAAVTPWKHDELC